MRWTQEEIGTQLGTVREMVSRTLCVFVKVGLIKIERQHITVLDSETLKCEAGL